MARSVIHKRPVAIPTPEAPRELSGRTGGSNISEDAAYYNGPHSDPVHYCTCGERMTAVAENHGVSFECPKCDGPQPWE